MKTIQTLSIILAIFFLSINSASSQEQPEFKKYQIDLSLIGPAKGKSFFDATISGVGFVYKQNCWAVNAQVLSISRFIQSTVESKGYIDVDILGGLRHDYKKFEFSIFTGVGYVYQKASEVNVLNSGEGSASTIGLPIKGKIDYWISERFAVGILAYYNVNSLNTNYGASLNLGYRF